MPKTFGGRMDVTEECFNQRPLRFAGNSQFIEDNLSKKRTEIPAIRTTNGTFPAGSQWTRNPVRFLTEIVDDFRRFVDEIWPF